MVATGLERSGPRRSLRRPAGTVHDRWPHTGTMARRARGTAPPGDRRPVAAPLRSSVAPRIRFQHQNIHDLTSSSRLHPIGDRWQCRVVPPGRDLRPWEVTRAPRTMAADRDPVARGEVPMSGFLYKLRNDDRKVFGLGAWVFSFFAIVFGFAALAVAGAALSNSKDAKSVAAVGGARIGEADKPREGRVGVSLPHPEPRRARRRDDVCDVHHLHRAVKSATPCFASRGPDALRVPGRDRPLRQRLRAAEAPCARARDVFSGLSPWSDPRTARRPAVLRAGRSAGGVR